MSSGNYSVYSFLVLFFDLQSFTLFMCNPNSQQKLKETSVLISGHSFLQGFFLSGTLPLTFQPLQTLQTPLSVSLAQWDWLSYLGPPSQDPQSGNWLYMETQEKCSAQLICVPSFRDQGPVLPAVQYMKISISYTLSNFLVGYRGW